MQSLYLSYGVRVVSKRPHSCVQSRFDSTRIKDIVILSSCNVICILDEFRGKSKAFFRRFKGLTPYTLSMTFVLVNITTSTVRFVMYGAYTSEGIRYMLAETASLPPRVTTRLFIGGFIFPRVTSSEMRLESLNSRIW